MRKISPIINGPSTGEDFCGDAIAEMADEKATKAIPPVIVSGITPIAASRGLSTPLHIRLSLPFNSACARSCASAEFNAPFRLSSVLFLINLGARWESRQ